MIEEDVTIARWGFAAMLIFASLMAAAFVYWLHEHGIHPSKPVIKFLHRPLGEVLIVLVCVGGLVHHGATKGFFGQGSPMRSPVAAAYAPAITPSAEDSDVQDEYSLSTNSTAPCVVGIRPPTEDDTTGAARGLAGCVSPDKRRFLRSRLPHPDESRRAVPCGRFQLRVQCPRPRGQFPHADERREQRRILLDWPRCRY